MADQSGYGDDHTKSTIGVISGPVKWTLVQQKIKTEKKKNEWRVSEARLGIII